MADTILVTGGSGYFGTVLAEQATAARRRGPHLRPQPARSGPRRRRVRRGRRPRPRRGARRVRRRRRRVPQRRPGAARQGPRAVRVGQRRRHRERAARRARRGGRQGRAHVVERGLRHPRAQPGHRGHAGPPARGLRPGQAPRRAAVPRRGRRRGSTSRSCGRAPSSATAGSGIMAILFEFVADGAPVFVLGGGDNRYQFVHANDLADACLRGRRAAPGRRSTTSAPATSARCARRCRRSSTTPHTGSRVRSLPVGPARSAMQACAPVSASSRSRRTTGCSTASRCSSTSPRPSRSSAGTRPTRTRRW